LRFRHPIPSVVRAARFPACGRQIADGHPAEPFICRHTSPAKVLQLKSALSQLVLKLGQD
jgi:hypothetical protein